MNHKALFALAAMTAVGAATAAVTSANTLCRIEVNSGAKSTIVGVPVSKVGATLNESIPVSSLVLTDNLVSGDTILHWNGTAWDAWVITVNGTTKTWTPTVVSEGSKVSKTAPAADTAIARGEAIWVNRNSATAEDLAKPFYIYGQLGDVTTAQEINVIAGTPATPAYTLIGNPQLADFPLNGIHPNYMKSGTSPVVGDKIVFVNSKNDFGYNEYTWQIVSGSDPETQAWCVKGRYMDGTTRRIGWVSVDDTVVVGPGEGCWYVSIGGNPTILWQDRTVTE